MTFQWTAVASFLYAEVAALLILCIPFISPLRWHKIFKFNLWNRIAAYWNKAFLAIIIILIVLFLDAVREVRKYSATQVLDKDAKLYPSSYDHIHMKLFRSQRNLYISGFSLFLWLVLRRVVTLITQLANEMASNGALKTQVDHTNGAAKKYMEENEKLQQVLNVNKGSENYHPVEAENKKHEEEIEKLKKVLDTTSKALLSSQTETAVLKKQFEGLTREYDRLINEHERLQRVVDGEHDKKAE
ncbi:B-cell receptor-associated protein 29-like [Pleurodeles waltl]|uniref:B-cell receptor-associated protein 29-like n=1 Tax=Pleurodeles waltl TaxID=8319 RepID=UPI003709B19F